MMQLLEVDGAAIAIGISVLFLLAAVVMHRVFVRILQQASPRQDRHD